MKQYFIAKGTTCHSCEEIIKRQAFKVEGVTNAHFDYSKEEGWVEFDENRTNIDVILYKIEEKGYECMILEDTKQNKFMGYAFTAVGIIIAAYFIFSIAPNIEMPSITQNMGYGLLFLVGLLTGLHCITMCGGFVLSYTAKDRQENRSSHPSHIKYAIGKTLSYTIIGAFFGLVGSIIAFTPQLRGAAGILAGLFLILFGLKLLNIFPALRTINLRTPRFIQRFVGKKRSKHSSPLIIGLLNGLMIACGPLQAIYIMAAGTGSVIEGAKTLFIFGLGTLPAMMAFGYTASFLSAKVTTKLFKVSGAIVIVLGLIMFNNGLVLTGTGFDIGSMVTSVSAANDVTGNSIKMNNGFQEIHMDVTRSGWEPNSFTLQKGIPVKWIINAKEITGCNKAINVPSYNLEFNLKPGLQTIEFTPKGEGVVSWSCWMGMIPGRFIVTEGGSPNEAEVQNLPPLKAGGGCGCGGCGGGA